MHRRLLFLVILGVSGALLVRAFLFETISIATGSMSPTLFVGTHYLVNKWVYYFRPPRRGEIISFEEPDEPLIGSIKRVIAIAGDEIELRQKKVILNGEPLEEPYAQYLRAKEKLSGDTMAAVRVPEGHVFVMGDNRDVSNDSTTWRDPKTGERIFFLPLSKIRGKVIQMP